MNQALVALMSVKDFGTYEFYLNDLRSSYLLAIYSNSFLCVQ